MIHFYTRRGAGQAYETLVYDNGEGIVYGRGSTEYAALRSAMARLERLKIDIESALAEYHGWDTAHNLAARLNLDVKTLSRLLFLLVAEGRVIHGSCEARGTVYRVPVQGMRGAK